MPLIHSGPNRAGRSRVMACILLVDIGFAMFAYTWPLSNRRRRTGTAGKVVHPGLIRNQSKENQTLEPLRFPETDEIGDAQVP